MYEVAKRATLSDLAFHSFTLGLLPIQRSESDVDSIYSKALSSHFTNGPKKNPNVFDISGHAAKGSEAYLKKNSRHYAEDEDGHRRKNKTSDLTVSGISMGVQSHTNSSVALRQQHMQVSHARGLRANDVIDERDEYTKESPNEKKHVLRQEEGDREIIHGNLREVPVPGRPIDDSRYDLNRAPSGYLADEARRLREEKQRQYELDLMRQIEENMARNQDSHRPVGSPL